MAKRFTLKSKLNGRIHDGSFIVDDQDVALVRQLVLRWHPAYDSGVKEVQVSSGIGHRDTAQSLHRKLMNAKRGEIVMFRDGDITNMRRSNMYLGNASDLGAKANKARHKKTEAA